MKRPVRVLTETVVALHEQLLAAFGGSGGVRDAGLLQSAMARRQNLLAYGTLNEGHMVSLWPALRRCQ